MGKTSPRALFQHSSSQSWTNAVYAGLPKFNIAPLQRVQNAAARLVLKLGSRDHVTPAFHQLHWLPFEFRIQFKLCMIMHIGHSPSCLKELVQANADWPSRIRMHSFWTPKYELPQLNLTFGLRAFSHSLTRCLELSTPIISVTGQ